jgi:hypothetical protein
MANFLLAPGSALNATSPILRKRGIVSRRGEKHIDVRSSSNPETVK